MPDYRRKRDGMTGSIPVPETDVTRTAVAPGWQPPDPAAKRKLPTMLRRRARLNLDERAALGMWAAARVTLLVLAWAAAWVFRGVPSRALLTGVLEHWDARSGCGTSSRTAASPRTRWRTRPPSSPATR